MVVCKKVRYPYTVCTNNVADYTKTVSHSVVNQSHWVRSQADRHVWSRRWTFDSSKPLSRLKWLEVARQKLSDEAQCIAFCTYSSMKMFERYNWCFRSFVLPPMFHRCFIKDPLISANKIIVQPSKCKRYHFEIWIKHLKSLKSTLQITAKLMDLDKLSLAI